MTVTMVGGPPSPMQWTKRETISFGATVAKQLGYKPGDPLEGIVDHLGGKMLGVDYQTALKTPAMEARGEKDFTIYLNPFLSGRYAKFSITQNIGLYVIHSNLGKNPITVPRGVGDDQVAREANWFAIGFLIPEARLREKLALGWSDAEIAEEFDVIESVAHCRIANLILSTEAKGGDDIDGQH